MYTHIMQLYIAGTFFFFIWLMLLGSVEKSGDQHAHLTIWTIFPLDRLYTKLAKQQTVRNTLK